LVAALLDTVLPSGPPAGAREVKRLARILDLPHRTVWWSGVKPRTGLPAAARAARYRLLAQAARAHGATHVLTAHTRDDQAETLLMRMSRGSGIAGLAAMARQSQREGVVLARPLLHVPKARLIATLKKARIGFADDPTNRDSNFTRPRFRALMPALAAEGFDARNLTRLASRLARANAALEILVDGAERYLAFGERDPADAGFDANAFAALAEEIRLRLLLRRIDRVGHEGPAELGKVEALLAALDRASAATGPAKGRIGLKQTLAGALVSLVDGRICIEPAPPRRRRAN
jgi:tRNA(Ile)-lysidine synthase